MAGKKQPSPEEMAKDIQVLLRQLHTIEHAQDREVIRELTKKYGFKL